MLVKLAFVMQRLKKYLKKFLSWSTKIGEGGGQFLDFMGEHSCYEGGHRAHGGSPVPQLGNPGQQGFPYMGGLMGGHNCDRIIS